MKDVILTTIHNYKYDQIRNFVNSIELCGTKALRAAVVYDLADDVIEKLEDKGFLIFRHDLRSHVAEQRFWDMVKAIKSMQSLEEIGTVFVVDCRDLVFQYDPCKWMSDNANPSLLLSSEGVLHKHEPWNKSMMINAYGHLVYERFSDSPVINAGVIAGSAERIKDLFMAVSLYNFATEVQPSDQTALNMIVNSHLMDSGAVFAGDEHAWAAQLHVKVSRAHELHIKNGALLVNNEDKPYCIVHQYDRSEDLSRIINEVYAEI